MKNSLLYRSLVETISSLRKNMKPFLFGVLFPFLSYLVTGILLIVSTLYLISISIFLAPIPYLIFVFCLYWQNKYDMMKRRES